MNRVWVFVLGVAVGAVAVAIWRVEPIPPERIAASSPSVPTAERGGDTARPSPEPQGSDAPSLRDALAAVEGDYEALIVDDNMMLGGRVKDVLSSEDFHAFVGVLSATPSALAAANYQQLEGVLHRLPAVRSGVVFVQGLACGRRICTATLVGRDEREAKLAWHEYIGGRNAEVSGEGVPVAMTETGFATAHGVRTANGFEWRLVIAVDENIRSFTGRRTREARPDHRRD